MSNTEYARPHTLRLDSEERGLLAVLVMSEIEDTTHRADAEKYRDVVRTLRSLLDRLTD